MRPGGQWSEATARPGHRLGRPEGPGRATGRHAAHRGEVGQGGPPPPLRTRRRYLRPAPLLPLAADEGAAAPARAGHPPSGRTVGGERWCQMTGEELDARLTRMEQLLADLVQRQQIKDYYEIDEFAELVGKAPFTVREWARLGRIPRRNADQAGAHLPRGLSATGSGYVTNGKACFLRRGPSQKQTESPASEQTGRDAGIASASLRWCGRPIRR